MVLEDMPLDKIILLLVQETVNIFGTYFPSQQTWIRLEGGSDVLRWKMPLKIQIRSTFFFKHENDFNSKGHAEVKLKKRSI